MSLQLEAALFEDDKLGYFNVHCGNSSQSPNAVAYRDKVVRSLQQINHRATKVSSEKSTTSMLLNVYHGTMMSGEMSYPNFIGDCRKLNYPNIDLLYQACDIAKVDCGHVFIHRDPYAILRSTGSRGFHDSIIVRSQGGRGFDDSILAAIHMYTTMLSVIQTQLWTHRHRTVGCWSILDPTEEVWQSIQRIFGWKSRIEMAKVMREIYMDPKSLPEEQEKEQIAPSVLAPFMDSFLRHHEDSVELCRQQAEANTHY